MSKLFKLKEWLTVPDAARHLSIAFGEEVSEAVVLRLALDERLKLSVNFVNHTRARRGKIVGYEDAEWRELPPEMTANIPNLPEEYKGKPIPCMTSLDIGNERYLNLDEEVTTIKDIWDLPMIGGERLDIEHHYQQLTGGPAVTLQCLLGAFVEGKDGTLCQLQESFYDNEYQTGSKAQLRELEEHIANKNIDGSDVEKIVEQHKQERKIFLAKRNSRDNSDNYYPAGALPEDSVLVVRTSALRNFEQSINDSPEKVTPTDRSYYSEKLVFLNQAASIFWANADRNERDTHPTNATVGQWLEQKGFSSTLASKAATIIRPEWAPTGRKPEE